MDSLFDVSQKVVCIAGGSRGLGKAVAETFAESGAKLIIGSWDKNEIETVTEQMKNRGLSVEGLVVDVSIKNDCERLIEFAITTYGHIDVMICNAGIDIIKPAEDYLEDEWNQILDVNLKGAFFCAQFASLPMLSRQKGSIILTTSIAGAHGIPGLAPYSASKGGMNMLVKTLGSEWADRGVRVNAVAPGYIDNIMSGVDGNDETEYQKRAMARTPMGRRGSLREFVGAYIFFASEASSYVTGSTIYVDGGYHAS
jgi:NAD(P)-dependent dehydrogenase (short-subunit alcohol dehydrogenase family)